jgi:hypothetical protein
MLKTFAENESKAVKIPRFSGSGNIKVKTMFQCSVWCKTHIYPCTHFPLGLFTKKKLWAKPIRYGVPMCYQFMLTLSFLQLILDTHNLLYVLLTIMPYMLDATILTKY